MENRLSWLTLSTPVKPYKKPKSALHTFALLKMGYSRMEIENRNRKNQQKCLMKVIM